MDPFSRSWTALRTVVAELRDEDFAQPTRPRRVEQDAKTWHARPTTTPTLAQSIQDLVHTVLPSIDLGALDPASVNGGDSPYDPQSADTFTQPGAQPIYAELTDSCASGGSGTWSAQIWTCGGTIDGNGRVPGLIEVGDQVKSLGALNNYVVLAKSIADDISQVWVGG